VIAWLYAPADPRRLAAIRIGLCAVLAARLTRTVYVRLADTPDALFRPQSFMRVLSSQPPRGLVIALQIIGVIAALLAMAGVRTRVSLPTAWTIGVVLGGMTTAIGKVVHNDVLLLLAIVPLLFAPCADAWAIDAPSSPPPDHSAYGFAVRASMIVVAFAYFFAGFWKLVSSGIAWVTSSNMRWVLYASSDGQVTPNAYALAIADRPWMAHVLAFVTLVVELGFPVVLFARRAILGFVVATVALHAGIWAAMRLDYWAQAATVVVVLVDLPRLIDRARGARVATI
jgi:hypothetical protein